LFLCSTALLTLPLGSFRLGALNLANLNKKVDLLYEKNSGKRFHFSVNYRFEEILEKKGTLVSCSDVGMSPNGVHPWEVFQRVSTLKVRCRLVELAERLLSDTVHSLNGTRDNVDVLRRSTNPSMARQTTRNAQKWNRRSSAMHAGCCSLTPIAWPTIEMTLFPVPFGISFRLTNLLYVLFTFRGNIESEMAPAAGHLILYLSLED
jgi:hypothetical protein